MELNEFPLVRMGTGRLAYGGDQEWFKRWRQRLAGCASVSGANLSAYYELGIRHDGGEEGSHRVYTFESYLQQMNVMYRYMTPSFKGFPYMWKYIEKFKQYAEDCGARAEAVNLKGWSTPEQASAFVRGAVGGGDPVAFLVLAHDAPEMYENTWHWMTITGFDEAENRVIISNYGEREVYDADVLFDPSPSNDMNMTYFKIER